MDLRMQDGLISKSASMNTRNIRRGRFAFVDIGNGSLGEGGVIPRAWQNQHVRPAKTRISLGIHLIRVFDGRKGPWLPFEGTAKTDQNLGPMGAELKNDVHYVLVVCNPDPLGQGT